MYRVAIFLIAIIGTSLAQQIVNGKCPSLRVVQPFTADNFGGSWYEWARYSSQTELETKCNIYSFDFGDNGSVRVKYSSIDPKGKKISLSGSAILPKPIGQFNVTIPEFGIKTLDYSVLNTDYENWAVIFACRDLGGNQHQRYLWFVTRSRCPSAADVISARNSITDHGLSTDPLDPVDQQHC